MTPTLTRMLATVSKNGKVVHTEKVKVDAEGKVWQGSLLCNLFNTSSYENLWRSQMLLKGDTITFAEDTTQSPFKIVAFYPSRYPSREDLERERMDKEYWNDVMPRERRVA